MRFQKQQEDYGLQLISMTDLVFLLLIFFMVTTSFVDFTRRLDIELPESKQSALAEQKQDFLVEVGVEKNIRLNGRAITLAELERRLKAGAGGPGRRTLTIKADKRLDYGFVVQIMGTSFAAGIRDISVAVKE
jgi:biopolymer transport protein ExbD